MIKVSRDVISESLLKLKALSKYGISQLCLLPVNGQSCGHCLRVVATNHDQGGPPLFGHISSFAYNAGLSFPPPFQHLSLLATRIIHLHHMSVAATVEYATCDLQFIESSAVALADTIILQKEPVDKVLARINAAGVSNISYTRTICLVVQQMIQILRRSNTLLYLHVKDEIVDRAVSTYINYWKVMYSPRCV